MKTALRTLAVLAALGLAGAAAVVGLGLYNVSAQVGHMPGVSWILHTTFRNSVALRAPPEAETPPLGDPDLIALGAGHYATACAPCHAGPDTDQSATMRAMAPMPPTIIDAIEHWKPNELHWIVENGVKMSGMPAWPAPDRGDEIWSVVAYLVALQKGAAPDLPVTAADARPEAYCATCHGRIGGPVPRLDIQTPAYLETQLRAYLTGQRPGGIMKQAASLVPAEDLPRLARHFAETPDAPNRPAPRTGLYDTGEALARRGTRRVPACLSCHVAPGEAQAKGPALHGQREVYLEQQMKLWRDGIYRHDELMQMAARDLTDDDIAALARYFAAADGDDPFGTQQGVRALGD